MPEKAFLAFVITSAAGNNELEDNLKWILLNIFFQNVACKELHLKSIQWPRKVNTLQLKKTHPSKENRRKHLLSM